jgi:putative two-component system response regulator
VAHAERTAGLAVALYRNWAQKRNQDPEQTRRYADNLHPAALLHDLGKIGVRPELLSKSALLSAEEDTALAGHCRLGAELLADACEISELAGEIALLHHPRWDQGGESIPLCARVSAIADAFDALVRPRACAVALSLVDAAALIRRQAGGAFDPELVECLMEILDVAEKIYQRFPELP